MIPAITWYSVPYVWSMLAVNSQASFDSVALLAYLGWSTNSLDLDPSPKAINMLTC